MLPHSPRKEVLSDHQEPGRPSNHKFSLVLGQKIRPKLNPMSCHMNNLHDMEIRRSIKNKIVSTIPYRPTYSRNANANSILDFLINAIQPIPKHICDISWRWNIVGAKNNTPNELSKRAGNKKMFNCLRRTTKGTLRTSFPLSFSQVILG